MTTQRSVDREARTAQVCYNIMNLLRAAAWHWRASDISLSLGALARGIGVWPITVGDMAANRTKQINMTTMSLAAWYFGVTTIDDLICYEPHGSTRQDSDTGQANDLEQLARGAAPAETPNELPDLRRQAPPQAPPAPESIVVINRIPAALAGVHHGEIAALTGQQQTNISRMVSRPLQRIARATLAGLLDALELDRVSDLIEVHLDLSATSSGSAVPPDAVRVDVAPFPAWKSTDWAALAQQWRSLANIDLPSGTLDPVDVAAIRYLYDAIANLKGRPPRLGGQLAQGLNVTRQAIGSVADGEYRKTIAADQTPPQIKRLIDRAVGRTATGSERLDQPAVSARQ